MKKIKFENKLGLNKQIVSKLNETEMYITVGGKKKKVRKTVKCTIVCTVSVPCMIDDLSKPLCDDKLPKTIIG